MAIFLRNKIYHYSFKQSGRTHRRSLRTSDHAEAEAKYAQIRQTAKLVKSAETGLLRLIPDHSGWLSAAETDMERLAGSMAAGMRHRAQKKGFACALTKQDVLELLRDCGGRCSVTGIPLALKQTVPGRRVSPWVPSIDRINSERGYEKGNCRIVCYLANIAMSQYGEDALEAMLFSYASLRWGKKGIAPTN